MTTVNPVAALVALLLVGCSEPDCFQDGQGLVWTDYRTMRSYDHRREEINGANLCYPGVGLTRKEIDVYGRKCPHPKQQIVDGWCRCVPRPDVLFTSEEASKWCKKVR